MESGYFAIVSLLVFFILNASIYVSSTTTFTVQIQNLMDGDDTLFAGCNLLNGRSLPKQEIKNGKAGNFTVHLRDEEELETMTCDLRSRDNKQKHGSFVLFDNLNWNVSAYCAPDSVCRWGVVPPAICLVAPFCFKIYYW
nr:hypothetical protein Itr_chr13CG02400 [Ipomoea trifida]